MILFNRNLNLCPLSCTRLDLHLLTAREVLPICVSKVWFSEIFGMWLGVLDPDKVVDNNKEGFIEYPFKKIEYETLGQVLISKNFEDTIWFTVVTYHEGGNIVGFNSTSVNFNVYGDKALF